MFKKNKTVVICGYDVIRSDRKSLAIEIKSDLKVIVRAPKRISDKDIERFIVLKQDWINKNLSIVRNRLESEKISSYTEKLSHEETESLREKARTDLTERAERYSKIMGVSFGRISIRTQKTLWGSCSAQGNLNFNCLLMLCPEKVRDYVVIHELCHLIHMNHSKDFWSVVEKYCPDCKACRMWLKNEGRNVISKIR